MSQDYAVTMMRMVQFRQVSTLRRKQYSIHRKVSMLACIAAMQCPVSVAVAQPHHVTTRTAAHAEATLSMPMDGPAAAPELMRSVAFAVSRTPLYDRWKAVASAPVPDRPEVAELLLQVRGQSRAKQLDTVNRWMNARLQFASDWDVYGEADHWATLAESLPRGRGDCEDYAIGKMQLLRAAGVPAKDMYLLVARDLVRRADHALLVVRVDNAFMVLDSSNDLLLTDQEVADYQPVMSFSGDQSWLHGLQQKPLAPTMVAATGANARVATLVAR
jgi:predicted transglutaminase-like cysteine proteinase